MTVTQKIVTNVLIVATLAIGVGLLAAPQVAAKGKKCGGVDVSILGCDKSKYKDKATKPEESPIWFLLVTAIRVLSVGVGVAAVGGFVWAGILYASAGGSSDQVKKAISIIINVVIGLLLFAFMAAILNFLIPGGVF